MIDGTLLSFLIGALVYGLSLVAMACPNTALIVLFGLLIGMGAAFLVALVDFYT